MDMHAGAVPEIAAADASGPDDEGAQEKQNESVRLCMPNGHLRPLAQIEADVIRLALCRYGEITEAARHLGIGRSTLYRKIASLPEFRREPGQWRHVLG